MLVYFDESYSTKDRLILGALFIPSHSAKKALHQGLREIKIKWDFVDTNNQNKEIKYNNITDEKRLNVAKDAIDLFFSRTNCYFRACVIPYSAEHLDKLGKQQGIPRKLKEAILYTNSFVKLIKNNIPEVRNAILLMDNLTRANGDKFDQIIQSQLGSGEIAIFRHISYVNSAAESNHTIQICDLLLGAILNDHYPTKIRYKNDFREYVKDKIGVSSLKEDYWGGKPRNKMVEIHPKYMIRFFGVPYKLEN